MDLKSSYCIKSELLYLTISHLFRLFTGNYKSNGNLVSFKVDIIDFTDFQRQGCLSGESHGSQCGGGQPHSHNITGTLVCQPDTNTVRLNVTVMSPPVATQCNDKTWSPPSSDTLLTAKEIKSWPASLQLNKPTNTANTVFSGGCHSSHDPVPPLLDFNPDQLMTDIPNLTFDIKEQLPGLYSEPAVTSVSRIVAPVSTLGSNPLLSQQQPLQQQSYLLGHHDKVTSVHNQVTTSHPTLLQPKLERSDSICSDYTPLKEEFLSYPDDLAGLDDLDNDNSLTPPTSITSPLLFSPTNRTKSPISAPQEKNTIFFNKSFEAKPVKLPSVGDSQQTSTTFNNINIFSTTAMSQPTSQVTFSSNSLNTTNTTINTINLSAAETRKPFTLSHNDSPKSFSSSPVSSPNETPITLLTSPKSRNRRNSSFDETKPHVCNQCGARFTTKSNLGQHAKIHLAVKPFICEICNHGFTRAAHYESHVAKHKGLKTHR